MTDIETVKFLRQLTLFPCDLSSLADSGEFHIPQQCETKAHTLRLCHRIDIDFYYPK